MRWPGFLRARTDWPTMRKWMAIGVAAGALGALAVVGLGLYNVSAKVGHWPGVSWVLHTTFRNAVALRAQAEPPADLDTPGMVALGAGHYDSGCKPCHAAPGERRSATAMRMEPRPPHAADLAGDWGPAELHWIVHQGIKMTGMPAWPATRADDVWPVVAFLRAAATMEAAEYARLTARPEGSYCAMCHGAKGVPQSPQIPRLDILSEAYIAESLTAYAHGLRDSGIMAEATSRVPPEAVAEIAAALAALTPAGPGKDMDELALSGRELAAAGGRGKVPACRACHGPWPEPLNPAFPSLAGQNAPYLAQQLRLWRETGRGGTPAADLMHQAARDLTDADIEALAAYYAALAPARLDETTE